MVNNILNKTFNPQWGEVERARLICSEYLESNHYEIDTIDAITMICSELVENAVKYGDFISTEDKISLNILLNDKIIIEVKCPIIRSKNQHFHRLDRIIQWIRGHQNPFEAYIEKLKMVAVKPLDDPEGGLGLFRIAYEGQAVLDFYVGDEGLISISAVYEVD